MSIDGCRNRIILDQIILKDEGDMFFLIHCVVTICFFASTIRTSFILLEKHILKTFI